MTSKLPYRAYTLPASRRQPWPLVMLLAFPSTPWAQPSPLCLATTAYSVPRFFLWPKFGCPLAVERDHCRQFPFSPCIPTPNRQNLGSLLVIPYVAGCHLPNPAVCSYEKVTGWDFGCCYIFIVGIFRKNWAAEITSTGECLNFMQLFFNDRVVF